MTRAKDVQVLAVPYDSGHRGVRMGAGPEHFLHKGLAEALRGDGRAVETDVVEAAGPFRTENATAFELFGLVAGRVREAAVSGRFPLVLSGNCNATVGTLAGVRGAGPDEEIGMVWFDGHADFKTPETSPDGFLDGMGLSIAVGHCWKGAVRTVPWFRPLREKDVVLVGTRGAQEADRNRLGDSTLTVVTEEGMREDGAQGGFTASLDELRARVRTVHVHLDLDVLDPATVGPANEYAPERGMTVREVDAAIRDIRERFRLTSANIASFDPAGDREGGVLRAGIFLAKTLAL